jgi:predicted nucleic acid-binding protein
VIVVSDAGPLIYLGSVGRLVLLRDLFGRVVVPQQVSRDLMDETLALAGEK